MPGTTLSTALVEKGNFAPIALFGLGAIVLAPQEPRRATLVERVIELPLLVGRFLWCLTCGLGG